MTDTLPIKWFVTIGMPIEKSISPVRFVKQDEYGQIHYFDQNKDGNWSDKLRQSYPHVNIYDTWEDAHIGLIKWHKAYLDQASKIANSRLKELEKAINLAKAEEDK